MPLNADQLRARDEYERYGFTKLSYRLRHRVRDAVNELKLSAAFKARFARHLPGFKEILPVYDLWNGSTNKHELSIGEHNKPLRTHNRKLLFYIFECEHAPPGCCEVKVYKNGDDFTLHPPGAWGGQHEASGQTFYAPRSRSSIPELERLLDAVHCFWHKGDKGHSTHMGDAWDGEEKDPHEWFFALKPKFWRDQWPNGVDAELANFANSEHVGTWGLRSAQIGNDNDKRKINSDLRAILGRDFKDPFQPVRSVGRTVNHYMPFTLPMSEAVRSERGRKSPADWQPVNFGGGTPDWHCDYTGNHVHVANRGTQGHACVLLILLTDCDAGHGGTVLVPGSHSWVCDHLQTVRTISHDCLKEYFGARIEEQLRTGDLCLDNNRRADGRATALFQVTGRAGDVFVMHPWCFHSGTENLGNGPRIMANIQVEVA